jgi:hypothetical protein
MGLAGLTPIYRPSHRPSSGSSPRPFVSSRAFRAILASGLAASLSFGCAKGGGTSGGNGTGGGNGAGTGGGSGSGATSGSGGGTGSGATSGSGGASTSSGGSTGSGGGSSSSGGNPGTGGSSSGGADGSGGLTGSGGTSPVDAATSDAVCQMADYTFAPKIPNVLILLDGSGTVFEDMLTSGGTTVSLWAALRSTILPLVNNLQGQVNFGLAVFTGVAPSQCPILQTVPIAPNNYTTLSAQYPTMRLSNSKLETPASEVLPMLPPLFTAATANGMGGNYILFATDGQTDFCDDGNAVCPTDAVVAGLQTLSTAGITTYIIGLAGMVDTSTCPLRLQSFANAGAGMPAANPCTGHTIYDECNNYAPWAALAKTAGVTTGQSLGAYQTTGGTAQVFAPDITDQTSLTNVLGSLFSGVKSCSFDLNNVNGTSITVNLNKLSSASVQIMGTTIPQDATNGWSMATSTQLILNGTSCATWKMPNNNDIKFNFPCDTIIFE